MRQDMFKVIVERPRSGVGYFRNLPNDYRKAKRFKLDDEFEVDDKFVGTKLPMKARSLGYDSKRLNENLRPLKRFLKSKVGQKWNDVFSEICENLDVNSTIKKHVRDHVPDFIELNTYEEDGEIYYRGYGRDYHISHHGSLYVHPVTGIIHDGKEEHGDWRARNREKLQKDAEERWKTKRTISNDLTFEKEKGTWFKIVRSFKWIKVYNWIDGAYKPTGHVEKQFAYVKHTVSKKDIRDYKLNE